MVKASLTVRQLWAIALCTAVSSWIGAAFGVCDFETWTAASYWPIHTAILGTIFSTKGKQ